MGEAVKNGYLQLGSVCHFCIGNCVFAHDYGCMHPGMPPGRNHFRRSRDAPILERSRQFGGTATAECQPMSKNYAYPTTLDVK